MTFTVSKAYVHAITACYEGRVDGHVVKVGDGEGRELVCV